jgi:hypothetical protein
MAYKYLSEITTSGQTWTIKVKVIRIWDSNNPSTDELISIDMILMDEHVSFNTWFLLLSGTNIFLSFCLEGWYHTRYYLEEYDRHI